MHRRIFNLEFDIRSTDWITTKVRHQEIYAQNLYAALCNNEYAPKDVWGILKNIRWDCSWRYAAGIVADIRERDDYTRLYCSGTRFNGMDFCGFVEESYVTEEIETDFNNIGWILQTRRYIDIP